MKIKQPYHPAILLLGIFLKEIKSLSEINIWTPCSLPHLSHFQKSRLRNNLKGPATEKWVYCIMWPQLYKNVLGKIWKEKKKNSKMLFMVRVEALFIEKHLFSQQYLGLSRYYQEEKHFTIFLYFLPDFSRNIFI